MNTRSVALKGVMAACCLMATACTHPYAKEGNYAEPIGSAPVLNNPTPYTDALYCMGEHFKGAEAPVPHVISVGKILDYTGKDDIETGRRLTQGAALMAMSALGKAGIPQVERFDTSVTELEIKFTDNKLLGDAELEGGVRRLMAGEIPGSGYHLIGG
ncbi:MAG: holdfast anchoring protein HfaB, partial [Geminicoccaceae bacterium]